MKRFLVLCSLFLFMPFAVHASVPLTDGSATGSPALPQPTGSVSPPKESFLQKLRGKIGKIIESTGASGTPHVNLKKEIIKGTLIRLLPYAYRGAAEALAAASTVLGYDPSAPEPKASATTTPAVSLTATTSSPSLPQGTIRISEAYPFPDSGEHEWIELIDRSNVGGVMDGWTIEDGKGIPTSLSGTLLPWTRMLIESPDGQLNDSGDLIVLKDAAGRVIDGVAYGDWASGFPNVGEVRRGESLIRMDMQEGFSVTTSKTPGGPNVLTIRTADLTGTIAPAAVPAVPVPAPEVIPLHLPTVPAAVGDDRPAAAKPAPSSAVVHAVPKKTSAPSRFKGRTYLGLVAAPPGVYSKTRMFALIDDALREVRLSKASGDGLVAGQGIDFIAQEKGDGPLSYLLANPDSIRMIEDSDDTAIATVEAWPELAGAYRFEAEVIARQDGVVSAMLGGTLGDILAPAALTASLQPGDTISIEGYVEPGARPRTVLTGVEALKLIKAASPEVTEPKPLPAKKLPWAASAGLTLVVAIIGLYSYLRHQRLQRMALILRPVDADEEI